MNFVWKMMNGGDCFAFSPAEDAMNKKNIASPILRQK